MKANIKHLSVRVDWQGQHVFTFGKAKVLYYGERRVVRLGTPTVMQAADAMGTTALTEVRKVVTRHVVEYLRDRKFTTFEDPETGIVSQPEIRE